ncbi:MAG: hypothetical protein WKF84_21965 [Pyrinomonadaceae bacterium]
MIVLTVGLLRMKRSSAISGAEHLRRDERLECISALDARDQVFRHKIGTAPITIGAVLFVPKN